MESEIPKKTKHKHRKRRPTILRPSPEEEYQKLLDCDFKIPGIVKLTLGNKTQRDLQCIVGEDITSEHQWAFVKKELVEDSLILNEESEFLPHRLDIVTYPRAEMLQGYAPDELSEADEFYLCVTENVTDRIDALVRNLRAELENRVGRAMSKTGRGWKSLGDVDDLKSENARATLEVELEAAYPVMSPKVRFKFRPVEDVLDGYAELLQPARVPLEGVVRKRRVSTGVQAAPFCVEGHAQTTYRFTSNTSTQYFYDYDEEKEMAGGVIGGVRLFNSEGLGQLCERIKTNGSIDFYGDDYAKLVTDVNFADIIKNIGLIEYLSFKELELTRNKQICSVCWHPMITGTVAIAYGKFGANVKRRGKPRLDPNEIVHRLDPVLIWCTDDALNPKLILECPRTVEVVSFCPFDRNVVIGGCINGQVLVWDITNRIERTEEVEVLTSAQRKHKVLLAPLVEWMKDTRDVSRVRTTAQSNLAQSHNAPISQIHWLPPSYRINKLGKIERVAETGEPFGMQFASCALDGCVMFWDLLAKSMVTGALSSRKKSHRLRVRPSGLTVDVSPFKHLDRTLMPLYRLSNHSSKKNRPFFLTSMGQFPLGVSYKNPRPETPVKAEERVAHLAIIQPLPKDFNLQLALGSDLGYFLRVKWEGYDVNPGEIINKEMTKVDYIGRHHDEPVTTVALHPTLPDVYLTVGGRVFAVWKATWKDKPLIWRSSRSRYLHAEWSSSFEGAVRLVLDNGLIEMWFFSVRTNKPTTTQYVSGSTVLGTHLHPLKCGSLAILGCSDFDASYRLFKIQMSTSMKSIFDAGDFSAMLDREIERKKAFLAWQGAWLKKHQRLVAERNAAMIGYKKLKTHEQPERKEEAQQKTQPLPGQYMQWARQQRLVDEEKRMKDVLLVKKQLNPNLLTEQQKPLKLFERAEEKKRKKQRDLLQTADEIFQDRVAMLFPEAMKKKLPPPVDPYASGDDVEGKRECLDEYRAVSRQAVKHVESNEFVYDFDWRRLMRVRTRRRRHDECNKQGGDIKPKRERKRSEAYSAASIHDGSKPA